MTVRIVTDSTSDIDGGTARGLGIAVVAQNVHFGALSFEDNVTITPDEFYERLATARELPTTSQASPGRFKEVYDELGRDADGIVSIHISARISGTCNSARQGALATSAGCPVEVIDSGQASMGLGLVVLAAAEAVMRGAGQFGGHFDGSERSEPCPVSVSLRDPGVPPEGRADRQGASPVGLGAEDQADDHRAGRRGASLGQGPDVPQGSGQDEGDCPRIRPHRIPRGDVQHDSRGRR